MKSFKDMLSKINYYNSRILQELSYKTGGGFGKPTGTIVLLTNRCNARCVHCQSWKLEPVDEVDTDVWLRTFHELRRWLGPIFISITGGETLLKKNSIDIAGYAAQQGFWVEFLTNGFLMDENKAEKLVRSGVKRIKISLDGSRPEIHNKVRGREGFFEKASWALKTLAEKRDELGLDLQIWGKTSIMSINVEDLPNIVTLASEMKIDGVEFQALEPVYYSEQLGDQDWYKDNPLWINDSDTLSKSIRELKAMKLAGYPVLNSPENLNLINNYFEDVEHLSYKIHSHEYKKKKDECRSWVGGLEIMPDGGMKMCHWMKPFANIKDGNIHRAYGNRTRCWKNHCPYLRQRED
ncbi:MAG: radical SAM protein [Thermodesulfovibrionales bacterium]